MMLFFQIGIVIYILAMFVFLFLNYRGYAQVPTPAFEVPPQAKVSIIVSTTHSPLALQNLLASLKSQSAGILEILVTEEVPTLQSIDIVEQFQQHLPHLRLFNVGKKPSAEWSGSTYARHQGALVAQGDWLLFLESGITLQPTCLATSLAFAHKENLEFLSLMPRPLLTGFWEKLILPICFAWFGSRFSLRKVNDPNHVQAIAVGQFMLMRRSAYQASGGFEKVRGEILEDAALAREFKRLAMPYGLLGGKHLIRSRVYHGLPEIWFNWQRIFVGELGSHLPSMLWAFLMIGLTSILPFANILGYTLWMGIDQVDQWVLFVITLQCVLVLLARMALDWIVGIRPLFSFLHPVGALFVLAILATSMGKTLSGNMEQVEGRANSEL